MSFVCMTLPLSSEKYSKQDSLFFIFSLTTDPDHVHFSSKQGRKRVPILLKINVKHLATLWQNSCLRVACTPVGICSTTAREEFNWFCHWQRSKTQHVARRYFQIVKNTAETVFSHFFTKIIFQYIYKLTSLPIFVYLFSNVEYTSRRDQTIHLKTYERQELKRVISPNYSGDNSKIGGIPIFQYLSGNVFKN